MSAAYKIKQNSSNTPAPRTQNAGERNRRILIVEDEPGIADAYRDILAPKAANVIPIRRSSRMPDAANTDRPSSSENFELTIATNAETALAEIKHAVTHGRSFTMGFFDVLLGGGMDGIELVKKAQEIDPNLFAVFVTAYSDRNIDSIQTVLGGGDRDEASRWDYLNKPFSHGEILQKARNGVAVWNLQREKERQDANLASLQRQLLENERLTTMATVARGIGHEFKNILNSILGKAELSQSLTTLDAVREQMKSISTGAKRAGEVLERFHFLHAPNEQKLSKQWTFADQPIEEALTLLSHELKANNVRVCWIRRKRSLVYGNATGLMQVFVNLTINAIHAMGTSGQIDLSIVETTDQVEIRFRDYGPGADPKIVSRLTEAFFTTKGAGGTGLGLAIAKDIIEIEHGGRFVAQNHEIKGFEVVIQLPMKETAGGNAAK